jgi:hypothetical protein
LCFNALEDAVASVKDFFVGESQNEKTERPERLVAGLIAASLALVDRTIDFDHQPFLGAAEVNDE